MAPACKFAGVGLWALGFGLAFGADGSPLAVRFHHLHVNDHRPGYLLSYYGRLFDPATTRPARVGSERGIEAAGVYLLITPVSEEPEENGAGWHFGWGTVTLGDAYDRHRLQEADLEMPLPGFDRGLHLHLQSADPLRAAAWYRDRLGAGVAVDAGAADPAMQPRNPLLRRAAAIVELPGLTLAIYKALAPLAPSRGQRIDHVAFKADLTAARSAGFTVLESGRLGPFETMLVEAPDGLAIELVGSPGLRR